MAAAVLIAGVAMAPGAFAGTRPTVAEAGAEAGVEAGAGTGAAGQDTFPAANGEAVMLPIQMRVRDKTNWSWAASGSTVAEYWGDNVSELQFCNLAEQRPQDSTSCPGKPAGYAAQNTAFAALGMNTGRSPAPTFAMIERQVDNGSPILADVRYAAGGDSVFVIFGYNPETESVYWADPSASAPRYNWSSYADFLHNGTFSVSSVLAGMGSGDQAAAIQPSVTAPLSVQPTDNQALPGWLGITSSLWNVIKSNGLTMATPANGPVASR
jgi:hypothetical protein